MRLRRSSVKREERVLGKGKRFFRMGAGEPKKRSEKLKKELTRITDLLY
jgi:hypothetical protein